MKTFFRLIRPFNKKHLLFKDHQDFACNYIKEMNRLGINNSLKTSVTVIFPNGEKNPDSAVLIRIDDVEKGEIFTSYIKR